MQFTLAWLDSAISIRPLSLSSTESGFILTIMRYVFYVLYECSNPSTVLTGLNVLKQIENSLITKKNLKRNLEKLTVTVQLFIDTIIASIDYCPP